MHNLLVVERIAGAELGIKLQTGLAASGLRLMAVPSGSQDASDSFPSRCIGRGKNMHPAAQERWVESPSSPSEVKIRRHTCVAVFNVLVGMRVRHAVVAYAQTIDGAVMVAVGEHSVWSSGCMGHLRISVQRN